ncbi:BSP-domain-containing protein [Wilcoxina mikolae CBS 423.85]|nr:BSP-domain-containing protein [Wilcoxina mikolae CBS 423.85]
MSPATLYNKEPPTESTTVEIEKKDKKPHDDKSKRRDPDGWYIPKLEFNAQDLDCAGCCKFFDTVSCHSLIRDAILGVVKRLYVTPDKQPTYQKSICLFIRPMGGVAYTAGEKNKQIHFSTDYINSIDEKRLEDEILGVIRHEMVHAWQYNANDTAPVGLIEGIADWVRLKDGFIPPHWKRGGSCWDDGYQNTAYFLDWLEDSYGAGTVVWINEQMKEKDYSDKMWIELSGGKSVEELWKMYTDVYGISNESKTKDSEGKEKEVVVGTVAAATEGLDAEKKAAAASVDVDGTVPAMDVKPIPVYHAAPPPDRAKIIAELETESKGIESSIAPTLDTESSYDPFPFRGEAALAEIFAERLKNLTFDGTKDGKRFVKVC